MGISWSFLAPIEQAQLLHFRPDLQFERDLAMGLIPQCPRPNCGGWIMNDDGELKCMLCSRIFNEHGDEIKPVLGGLEDMRAGVGFHAK